MMKSLVLSLSLIASAAIASPAEKAPPVSELVPRDQIQAIVACMEVNACNEEVTSKPLDGGVVLYSVGAANSYGDTVVCFLGVKDSHLISFIITVLQDDKLFYLEDDDRDGKVDLAAGPLTKTTPADAVPVSAKQYPRYQLAYHEAMRFAIGAFLPALGGGVVAPAV